MTRYEKLQGRRADPDEAVRNFSVKEAYADLKEGENTRYALGVMESVKPEYTSNTFKECDRVQSQLARAFDAGNVTVEFSHQGSVTNNTHVKNRSDIDLLTVVQRFYWIEPPNKPLFPYAGDAVADLRTARTMSVSTLRERFPEAKIIPGSKSIRIEGGSLRRDVDVVTCAWWHTVEYHQTNDRKWLGVGVLDNDAGKEVTNKPFLHNDRIDVRDAATNGNTRKVIRLLKSLMYDSEGAVTLSSYDIAGIAYNMYDNLLNSVPAGRDLLLLEKADRWLNVLEFLPDVRAQIEVPNGSRKVFGGGGATLEGVRQLRKELAALIAAVNAELVPAKRKLEEVLFPSPNLPKPSPWIPNFRAAL